ncbi:hypothetical protein [Clostridium perfringens]|uniref:Nucleotide exchange factor GrpE n=2 Tax=Clostridium perfringens TaxID=1502 RepID=A0A8H9QYD6_CLOPF|nr:hypothetical protein [Clostridium perfringens]MDU7143215.1 hypothetical protein [Anaerococcus vaginalis]MDU7943192.1 hypothetical protein [Streptococcus salivarius]MDU7977672.1 hypothetical protein [Clostridioides difficile]EDT15873.1 hypothetical protein AC3_A0252 [Clostridium perfringens E str. JGS1987]EGS5729375.1 nucleotide exchange factor GrpE [Clostridium perfringens]
MDLFNYDEVSKLLNEIENLKLENKRLNDRIAYLEKELDEKTHRKFKLSERELIKMYAIQQKEDGSYPTIRELAKTFNCSTGLIHNIVKNIRKSTR